MQTAERAWPVPCNSTPDHSRAIICYSCQRRCMPAWLKTAWHALQCRLAHRASAAGLALNGWEFSEAH